MSSNISKQEQKKNPQAVLDVLNWYDSSSKEAKGSKYMTTTKMVGVVGKCRYWSHMQDVKLKFVQAIISKTKRNTKCLFSVYRLVSKMTSFEVSFFPGRVVKVNSRALIFELSTFNFKFCMYTQNRNPSSLSH